MLCLISLRNKNIISDDIPASDDEMNGDILDN